LKLGEVNDKYKIKKMKLNGYQLAQFWDFLSHGYLAWDLFAVNSISKKLQSKNMLSNVVIKQMNDHIKFLKKL